jgi:hypothetical protein
MSVVGDLERLFAGSLYPLRVPLFIGGVVIAVLGIRAASRRGWFAVARANPGPATVVLALILAVTLPLGWYLGSPLFITTRIDEAPPVAVASVSPAATAAAPSPSLLAASVASSAGLASPAVPPTATASPGPAEQRGTFQGADDFHFGRGTARLIGTADGAVLRLESFAVRNGPDLYVYLSPDADGYARKGGNLEVGRLKASEGNQNYRLPTGTDPSGYRSVVIWCRQFSVQFAVAPLRPI